MTAQPKPPTRRRCLHLLAAGSASALVPASWLASSAAAEGARDLCTAGGVFAQPLYVPGTDGWLARLAVEKAPLAMRASARNEKLAFEVPAGNRTIANPTLVAAAGASVRVELVNALAEPTIVHWHGFTMDTRNDGNGEALIAPGERYDYAFQLRNRKDVDALQAFLETAQDRFPQRRRKRLVERNQDLRRRGRDPSRVDRRAGERLDHQGNLIAHLPWCGFPDVGTLTPKALAAFVNTSG